MSKTRGVYQRGARWYIRYADAQGRIRHEAIGSKSMAIEAYRMRKTQVREGVLFPNRKRAPKAGWHELCDYFTVAHPEYWSLWTVAKVREWFDGAAESVTPQQIQEKLNELKLGASAVNGYLAVVSAIFSWGIKNKLAKENPAAGIHRRRVQRDRTRFLEYEEEDRLLLEIDHPRRCAMVTLAVNTGLRQREQTNLKADAVDLARGFILVRQSKSGRGRDIPINDEAKAALETLMAHVNTLRSTECRQQPVEQFVCAGCRGSFEWFREAVRRAKIQNLRWHDLRHTFASRLAMAGVHMRAIQELMGHSSMAMTERYAHLAPSHIKDAVKKLSRTAAKTEAGPSATNVISMAGSA